MNRYTVFYKNVLIYEQTPGKFSLETVTHTQCYPEGVKWDCEFAEEYITKYITCQIKNYKNVNTQHQKLAFYRNSFISE